MNKEKNNLSEIGFFKLSSDLIFHNKFCFVDILLDNLFIFSDSKCNTTFFKLEIINSDAKLCKVLNLNSSIISLVPCNGSILLKNFLFTLKCASIRLWKFN